MHAGVGSPSGDRLAKLFCRNRCTDGVAINRSVRLPCTRTSARRAVIISPPTGLDRTGSTASCVRQPDRTREQGTMWPRPAGVGDDRRRRGRAHHRGERGPAVHGAVRRTNRSAGSSRHGSRRIDAVVGGGVLSEPRGRWAVRDPLRPPRHGPIDHLRTRAPRLQRCRPCGRRCRGARCLRSRVGTRGGRLRWRGHGAALGPGLRRSCRVTRAHQHLACDSR